jgi:hypothetical protein
LGCGTIKTVFHGCPEKIERMQAGSRPELPRGKGAMMPTTAGRLVQNLGGPFAAAFGRGAIIDLDGNANLSPPGVGKEQGTLPPIFHASRKLLHGPASALYNQPFR